MTINISIFRLYSNIKMISSLKQKFVSFGLKRKYHVNQICTWKFFNEYFSLKITLQLEDLSKKTSSKS